MDQGTTAPKIWAMDDSLRQFWIADHESLGQTQH